MSAIEERHRYCEVAIDTARIICNVGWASARHVGLKADLQFGIKHAGSIVLEGSAHHDGERVHYFPVLHHANEER